MSKTTKKPAARKSSRTAKGAPKKAGPANKANAKPAANRKEKAKKLSAIDAAAQVLGQSKAAMTTKEMVDAIAANGLWKSPGGKTPDRTLYSAILREIATKGKDARFQKTERGKFAATA